MTALPQWTVMEYQVTTCKTINVSTLFCCLLLSTSTAAAEDPVPPETPGQSQLWTYATATGERCFALSLTPDLQPGSPPPTDAVIVFDTSASQTGLYRTDGLNALQTLLDALQGDVRVRIMAGDLQAVAMSDGFAPPGGSPTAQAVARLRERPPLGSTDMNAVLRGALEAFPPKGKRTRQIIYIGDGISRANLFEQDEFSRLLEDLVTARATVSSFAIGPERDVPLLAAIANQTGGMVYLDAMQDSIANQAGLAMARVALTPVAWPTSIQLPAAIKESYPATLPPLRLDRDTILVGVLEDADAPLPIHVTATVGGREVQLDWTVTPQPSSDEYGYLPQLVDAARENGGLTLTTIGSIGLRQTGRQILAAADSLAEVGAAAMKTGDIEGARRMAESVLRRDPSNPQALAILRAIEKQTGSDDSSLILGPEQSGEAKPKPSGKRP